MQLVDAILRLIRALVATAVIGSVAFMAYLVVSLRLELVKPQFFILGFAITILLASVWLRAQGYHNAGSLFAGAAVFTMTVIGMQAAWPGVFGYLTAHKAILDRSAAVAAQPHPVPCVEPFFIGAQEPRYWVSESDDPVVCYDRPGLHPRNGRPLTGITPSVAKLALLERNRSESVAVRPIPTVTPTPHPMGAPVQPTPAPTPRTAAITIVTAADGTARIEPAP